MNLSNSICNVVNLRMTIVMAKTLLLANKLIETHIEDTH